MILALLPQLGAIFMIVLVIFSSVFLIKIHDMNPVGAVVLSFFFNCLTWLYVFGYSIILIVRAFRDKQREKQIRSECTVYKEKYNAAESKVQLYTSEINKYNDQLGILPMKNVK